MKWSGRVISFLVALVTAPSPLIIWALAVKGFEGLGLWLYYVFAVLAGAAGIVLVAVPGLIYLDRAGPGGVLPRLALGVGVGVFTGATGVLVSELIGGTDVRAAAVSLIAGTGFGVLGTAVYWLCNRWCEHRIMRISRRVT